MKVAIVGLGHVAQHQIDAIRQLTGIVDLVGAYDTDAGVTHKHAVPCHFHTSLDDLIEHSIADVVVVSTSNSAHFAVTSKLLRAGRAVMVEKPICENRKDLNELLALAKAGNIFFHAALHAAFARELLWWIENRQSLTQRFGPIEHFQMDFFDPYIENDGSLSKSAKGLGGSWYDSGINALSVLGCLADPASIKLLGAQMHISPRISRERAADPPCFRVRPMAEPVRDKSTPIGPLASTRRRLHFPASGRRFFWTTRASRWLFKTIENSLKSFHCATARPGLPTIMSGYSGILKTRMCGNVIIPGSPHSSMHSCSPPWMQEARIYFPARKMEKRNDRICDPGHQ